MSVRFLSALGMLALAATACGGQDEGLVSRAEAISICNEVGLDQLQLYVDWDTRTASQRSDAILLVSRNCESPREPSEFQLVGDMVNYACTAAEAEVALRNIWRIYLIALDQRTTGELDKGFPGEQYEKACDYRQLYRFGE